MRAPRWLDTRDAMAEAAAATHSAGRAWFLLAVRLGSILILTVVMWLLIRAATGVASFPPSTTWATLGLLPVNMLCLVLVRRFYQAEGVSLRAALGIQKGRIGRDVLWGLLWLFVLNVPFMAVVAGTVFLLHGNDAPSAFATIFYDPNIRDALINDLSETRRIVDSSVALSDIVKASVTDLRTLYGQLVDPAQVARRWLSLGPALVIITRGSDGADVYSARGGVFNQPAPHVAPVDTVGAGAAFFAALIDGITRISMDGAHNREYLRDISDASLHTLIAYASTAAAVTVSRAGASLPTRAELIDHHEFYQTSGMTGMLRR